MNYYDFFTDAMLDAAINIPINFDKFQVDPNLDLESLFTNPVAFAPLEDAIFAAPVEDPVDFNIDDWLNSLPVQSPTPAPESSAPEAQSEDTPPTPSTDSEHTPEQEACCPEYEDMELHDALPILLDAAINIPINFDEFQVDPNLDLESLFTNPVAFAPLEEIGRAHV